MNEVNGKEFEWAWIKKRVWKWKKGLEYFTWILPWHLLTALFCANNQHTFFLALQQYECKDIQLTAVK